MKEEWKVNTTQCKSCYYWDSYLKMCDYTIIEGIIRPCEPSPFCTEYKIGDRASERIEADIARWLEYDRE